MYKRKFEASNFQISKETIKMVKKYKEKFPELFEYIDFKVNLNNNTIFGLPRYHAEDIFKESEDCNVTLVYAYIWAI